MEYSNHLQTPQSGTSKALACGSRVLVLLAMTSLLCACASSVSVQRVQAGDENLSCESLATAMQDADKFRVDAQQKKGVTGTNTAAALLFWPALLVTYSDANAAIQAADTRKQRLAELRVKKGCG